jgi:hypothetical protein
MWAMHFLFSAPYCIQLGDMPNKWLIKGLEKYALKTKKKEKDVASPQQTCP